METAFKIRASFDSQKLLEDLLRKHKLDVGCTGGITVRNNRYSIDIYASKKEVNKLRKEIIDKGLSKRISLDLTDITDYLSDRLKEVGTGDRYKRAKGIPRGLGTKVKE
jgi:hypothetical protein